MKSEADVYLPPKKKLSIFLSDPLHLLNVFHAQIPLQQARTETLFLDALVHQVHLSILYVNMVHSRLYINNPYVDSILGD